MRKRRDRQKRRIPRIEGKGGKNRDEEQGGRTRRKNRKE